MLLLISNCELALRLLVLLGELLERFDGFGLQDFDSEFDIASGVFVARLERSSAIDRLRGATRTYVDLGIVRQSAEDFVQRCVHLLSGPFEETAASCTISTLA